MQELLSKYTSASRTTQRSSTGGGSGSATKRAAEVAGMSNDNQQKRSREMELQRGIVPIYFLCNEGSVTHFYHFMFGALVPLIEYHLKTKHSAFRIKTDIGPMKSILCEMPFNIVEICGPSEETPGQRKAHDDKSAYSGLELEQGSVRLCAYDSFDQFIYEDTYAPKFDDRCRANVLAFFQAHIPSYISCIRPVKIVLIDRKADSYYQQVKHHNRTEIYGTSGAERR